ncbi:hypothetical protein HII31_12930 [Pseudocercospora fuligena]|uniref:RING-type domain-containing protein n=1 Tax=Pseudocercospora fuligena TaxID=685502 RepID=A0A8H6VEZ1_9PEZI|nr:hypothetical protein HII31_12930 [Pseudocercospora fuligena]
MDATHPHALDATAPNRSLPSQTEFFANAGLTSSSENLENGCPICSESQEKVAQPVTLPCPCKLTYCTECIVEWLTKTGKGKCPTCRTRFFRKMTSFGLPVQRWTTSSGEIVYGLLDHEDPTDHLTEIRNNQNMVYSARPVSDDHAEGMILLNLATSELLRLANTITPTPETTPELQDLVHGTFRVIERMRRGEIVPRNELEHVLHDALYTEVIRNTPFLLLHAARVPGCIRQYFRASGSFGKQFFDKVIQGLLDHFVLVERWTRARKTSEGIEPGSAEEAFFDMQLQ